MLMMGRPKRCPPPLLPAVISCPPSFAFFALSPSSKIIRALGKITPHPTPSIRSIQFFLPHYAGARSNMAFSPGQANLSTRRGNIYCPTLLPDRSLGVSGGCLPPPFSIPCSANFANRIYSLFCSLISFLTCLQQRRPTARAAAEGHGCRGRGGKRSQSQGEFLS